MLAAAGDEVSQRHVLVGHHDAGYQAALGLRSDDVVYATRKSWQLQAVKSAILGRIGFVSNAGEIQMNTRRIRISWADLVLVGLVRLRGGAAIQTGFGIRDTQGKSPLVVRALARLCTFTVWRDAPSRDLVGIGEVEPDWAFALGQEAKALIDDQGRPRDLLAVTMRGDRDSPPQPWLDAVRGVAEQHGLDIVVVTQVGRDRQRSEELAELLGGQVRPWLGDNHLDQENNVREVYRESAAVISDRLHALILGLTEGAVPIGLTVGPTEKISRTFEGAGLKGVAVSIADTTVAGAIEFSTAQLARRELTLEQLGAAQTRLGELKSRMLRVLGSS